MLKELNQKFGFLKSLEIMGVKEGIKPVSRIMVNDLVNYKDMFNSLGLEIEKSEFKVSKVDNGAFSNKGEISDNGQNLMYISRDKHLAEDAKFYEAEKRHIKLGKLLGYPDCCSEFFDTKHNEFKSKDYDLLPATLDNSKGYVFPYLTNIGSRYFGFSLLSHFPCSFNCKKSIEIAEQNLEMIDRYSLQFGKVVRQKLQSAILHTTIGTYLLNNPKLKDNNVFYDNVDKTADNKLYSYLIRSKAFEVVNKKNIKINDLELKRINFMLFV